jgi:hypothetical protein
MLYDGPQGWLEVGADGSGKHSVWFGGGQGEISPDGTQVASRRGATDPSPYITGINGNPPYPGRKLAPTSGAILSMAWMRDGKALIVDSDTASGHFQLEKVPTDGSPAKPIRITGIGITSQPFTVAEFSISPSQTRIVFSVTADYTIEGQCGLYTVPISGGHATCLPGTRFPTNPPPGTYLGDLGPQWSPDGSLIAFNHIVGNNAGNYRTDVFVIQSGGGRAVDLDVGLTGRNWVLEPQPWRPLVDTRLRGTLWVTDCTDTGCRRAGAPREKITVSGKDTLGNAVKASTTSDGSGKWSLFLPEGNYTVTPPSGFVPNSKTVKALIDADGVDFATCGVLGSSASHRSRRLTAGGESGCPNGIDWKMGDRAQEAPVLAEKRIWGVLSPEDVYAPLHVFLYLSVGGSRVTRCSPGSVWRWSLRAKPADAKVFLGPISPGCQSEMYVSRPGSYTILARRYVRGGLRQTVAGVVPVRDLIIAAMGDSNGSGEGLPPFWSDQCNRGWASYQYQAAKLLQHQSSLHTSVTFVSASCSGARIAHLVDTPYDGVRPGPELPAQIRQIQHSLVPRDGGPRRTVDAALISIGINDLAFGPILEYCVKLAAFHHEVPPCQEAPTVAQPGTGPITSFKYATSDATLSDLIDGLIRSLPAKYDQLARALSDGHLVRPSHVYLTQYPSFAYKDAKGDLCGYWGSGATNIVQSTWEWLAGEGAKLNNAVTAAAAAHGWNVITVPRQLFFGHGYCTGNNAWFVGLGEALKSGNISGAFHATERGARVTAVLTLESLCPMLEDRRMCKSFPEP